MRKNYAAALCCCMLSLFAVAQDVPLRYFEIKPLWHKKNTPAYTRVPYSMYNSIGFLDSREDTGAIGTVSIGLLKNRDAKLKLRTPFQPQLQTLLDSLVDSTARNGRLLFQLRNFFFVEESGSRYCYIQAGLYAKAQDAYHFMAILDTTLIVTGTDVLGIVQDAGNRVLANFLSSELMHIPQGSALYTLQDIASYDSAEKSRIPVYTAQQYADGLYYTYSAFFKQQPDQQGNVTLDKHGAIDRIEIDTPGKKVKIKSKNLYAVVVKGKPFIATEYGYYPVEKLHNNFFFTGDIRVASSEGEKGGAQIAFGLVGRALASGGYKTKYDLIIDYNSGTFIHLHKIPDPPQQLY